MKKSILLLTLLFSMFISGCTILYNYSDDETNGEEDSNNDSPYIEDLEIDSNALIYPANLTLNDQKITNYHYVDSNLSDEYKIYSAYYSEEYDTIYIAYDSISNPTQTLKAKDLYEIEKHAVNYFVTDANRSEDREYLKAVRIYPDRIASSCRRDLDDETAYRINGCADYGGKEATIDLNSINNLNDFFNPKKYTDPYQRYYHEPMRDTFAHEYGHIATFYHMNYKNDEDYEDYLKMRLENSYDTIYPNGLPTIYSTDDSYSIQPEEILADDFVELFYDLSVKKPNDNIPYILEYENYRNSLPNSKLKESPSCAEKIRNYYFNLLNYENKQTYSTPIVISKTTNEINYYESYSKIGDASNLKSITSLINVNLIAVGETTVNDIKYYRVILSNTFKFENGNYNKKDVGKMMGYVIADEYTENTTLKIYKLNKNGNNALNKNSILPIENNQVNKLYILPYYDFSYVLNTTTDEIKATMYDYLNPALSNTQTYAINIYSFGTAIN